MSLADSQALLWRAITWPTGVDAFLREADEATRAAFASTFADSPEFARAARVGVYADAYFWRLLGVLRDHFGLTAWLCGPAHFHDLVTDYVLQRPSIDPDVRRFGERFAGFIAGHREGVRIPGLAELAAIEWAMVRALDVAQEQPQLAEQLRALAAEAWPSLRLCAVHSAALLPSTLPFSMLWAAHDREPSPTEPPSPVDAHAVLVWRQGLDVVHRVPAPDEAAALARVLGGIEFAELCADHDAPTVVAWLQRWLADELLTR
jgi:hypothetical protein